MSRVQFLPASVRHDPVARHASHVPDPFVLRLGASPEPELAWYFFSWSRALGEAVPVLEPLASLLFSLRLRWGWMFRWGSRFVVPRYRGMCIRAVHPRKSTTAPEQRTSTLNERARSCISPSCYPLAATRHRANSPIKARNLLRFSRCVLSCCNPYSSNN